MYIDRNALSYFWAKIKAKFASAEDVSQLSAKITELEQKIAQLETSKQDKIDTWGDLANK